jgi:hypothetical protein
MGEDAQSSLVGRCAGVEDPRRRRGATNSCSDSARGSHEHERETAPSLPVAAWARSVLCCGRAPTNQVGQRGWEANRENLPSASSMTPPLQRASLGAAISVAETRRDQKKQMQFATRCAAIQTPAKARLEAAAGCLARPHAAAHPDVSSRTTKATWVHDWRRCNGGCYHRPGGVSTGMAWRASQRRALTIAYSPISPTAGRLRSVIVHSSGFLSRA